jgi:hypothetical protein
MTATDVIVTLQTHVASLLATDDQLLTDRQFDVGLAGELKMRARGFGRVVFLVRFTSGIRVRLCVGLRVW